jgi:hypothetical protein
MSEIRRPPALGTIAFGLAIAAVVVIPTIVLLSLIVDVLGPRRAPVALLLLVAVFTGSIPVLAIASVFAGHLARHRDRRDSYGLYGLLVGYGLLGFTAVGGIVAVGTFVAIR